jgi:hypothetical protein
MADDLADRLRGAEALLERFADVLERVMPLLDEAAARDAQWASVQASAQDALHIWRGEVT